MGSAASVQPKSPRASEHSSADAVEAQLSSAPEPNSSAQPQSPRSSEHSSADDVKAQLSQSTRASERSSAQHSTESLAIDTIQAAVAETRAPSPDFATAHLPRDAGKMSQRLRFGAFSASGTLESGVTHKTRKQGRALPGAEYPWRLNRQLYQADGTTIKFSEYLAKKVLPGAFKPDSIFEMEVSDKQDFSHPFTVFVSTIGMVADGIIHGHEAFWPLCCWAATDLTLGQAVSKQVNEELNDIMNLPIFVHVNAASDRLIPIIETGHGMSPWGVKACGEDGFDTQQAFWSASPMSKGTHGWRIIAEATMFDAQGTEDLSALRNMIKSAAKVYNAVA